MYMVYCMIPMWMSLVSESTVVNAYERSHIFLACKYFLGTCICGLPGFDTESSKNIMCAILHSLLDKGVGRRLRVFKKAHARVSPHLNIISVPNRNNPSICPKLLCILRWLSWIWLNNSQPSDRPALRSSRWRCDCRWFQSALGRCLFVI